MQDEVADPWSLNSNHPNLNPTLNSNSSSSTSTLTSRHPLNRTPSPSNKTSTSNSASGMSRRRTAASSTNLTSNSNQSHPQPQSEWSTLGAGIASLFGSGNGSNDYHTRNGWLGSSQGGQHHAAAAGRLGSRDRDEQQPTIGDNQQEQRDRNKGHSNPLSSNGSALDKLEGWFGITPTDPQSQSTSSNLPRSSRPSTSPNPSTSTSKTRLVHVHQVTPSDSLSSIALLYGSDVPSLRRANRLWPGDSAQMRSRIYIPVDQCKFTPPSEAEGDDPEMTISEEDWRENAREGGADKEDAASDFLPDTNKAYADPNSIRNASNPISGLVVGYPASLNPSHRAASSTSSSLAPISGTSSHPRRAASSSSTSLLPRSSYASSSGSAAESSSAAASRQKSQRAQPTRVPNETLSFFPPASSSPAIDKGKRRMDNLSSNELDLGASDLDPGESGLDDLLRAREKEREMENTGGVGKEEASRQSLDSSSLLSHGSGAQQGEESSEWQPNKWTFGKGGSVRRKPNPNGTEDSNVETNANPKSNLKPLHLLERSSSSNGGPSLATPTHQNPHSHPPPPPSNFSAYASDIASIARSSTGWNDAPPIDSKVSHAYSGKGAGKKKNHHRILNDLAAGLPPNSGAAQNWARPIAGSLPLPPPPPTSSTNGMMTKNAASTPSIGTSSGAGWGKLFNDTLRGRIHLDDAFAVAASQINSPSTNSNSNSNPSIQNKLISNLDEPPQRLSADLARATLGRRSSNNDGNVSDSIAYAWSKEGEDQDPTSSSASNPNGNGGGRNGIETAHRLERMDSRNQLKDSLKGTDGMERQGSGGFGGVAGRRRGGNVRQIDWTSEG